MRRTRPVQPDPKPAVENMDTLATEAIDALDTAVTRTYGQADEIITEELRRIKAAADANTSTADTSTRAHAVQPEPTIAQPRRSTRRRMPRFMALNERWIRQPRRSTRHRVPRFMA